MILSNAEHNISFNRSGFGSPSPLGLTPYIAPYGWLIPALCDLPIEFSEDV